MTENISIDRYINRSVIFVFDEEKKTSINIAAKSIKWTSVEHDFILWNL